jgi:hypothetical protein
MTRLVLSSRLLRTSSLSDCAVKDTSADTLSGIKDMVDEEEWFKQNRERLMLKSLEPQLKALIEKHPRLKEKAGKAPLYILMTIGSQYTTLGTMLDEQQTQLKQPPVTQKDIDTGPWGALEQAVAQTEVGILTKYWQKYCFFILFR